MKSLKIMNKIIKIKYVARMPKDTLGLAIYDKQLIKVKKGLPPDVEKEVLYHEIAHHYIEYFGHNNSFTPDQLEMICDVIGRILIDYDRNKDE